jgi:hypothetical protein
VGERVYLRGRVWWRFGGCSEFGGWWGAGWLAGRFASAGLVDDRGGCGIWLAGQMRHGLHC